MEVGGRMISRPPCGVGMRHIAKPLLADTTVGGGIAACRRADAVSLDGLKFDETTVSRDPPLRWSNKFSNFLYPFPLCILILLPQIFACGISGLFLGLAA